MKRDRGPLRLPEEEPIVSELLLPPANEPAPATPPQIIVVQQPAAPAPQTFVTVRTPYQETNGFGEAAFWVSLLSLLTCGLLPPLGVFMGLIALAWRPRGHAAAGLLVGLIGSWWVFVMGFFGFAGLLALIGVGQAPQAPPPAPPREVVQRQREPQSETMPVEAEPPASEPPPQRPRRVWTSANGKFSTEAEFLSRGGDKVKLRKPDGAEITVSLESLSDADRQWLTEYERSIR